MTPWRHDAVGAGPPLALLHGIGMSRFAWAPVVPLLAERRRVLAFDLPGFGATPPLPAGVAPTAAALAGGLVESLRALGIEGPVELAGNSLGGLVALEAAKRGAASRVVAISPAGLWVPGRTPAAAPFLKALRASARLPGAAALVRVPAVREAALLVGVGPGCGRMSAADAVRLLTDFAAATTFGETLDAVRSLEGGETIACPVTVAFGGKDRLLGPKYRRRDRLPPQTRWVEPPGWGHVPMWRDPAGVAGLILGDAAGAAAS